MAQYESWSTPVLEKLLEGLVQRANLALDEALSLETEADSIRGELFRRKRDETPSVKPALTASAPPAAAPAPAAVHVPSEPEKSSQEPPHEVPASRPEGIEVTSCPAREERPHDFQELRDSPEIYVEACVSCNLKRWFRKAETRPIWTYGDPPAAPRARVMLEEEELAVGEEFVPTDGNVPREITGPQELRPRVVGGRRILADKDVD